VSVTKQFNLEA